MLQYIDADNLKKNCAHLPARGYLSKEDAYGIKQVLNKIGNQSGSIVMKSISHNRLCEGRSYFPRLDDSRRAGTLIRALLYGLVLTVYTRRLGWIELFVMALGDVDLAEGLG